MAQTDTFPTEVVTSDLLGLFLKSPKESDTAKRPAVVASTRLYLITTGARK
jgi:hypothetical protein